MTRMILALLASASLALAGIDDYERDPINYSSTSASDRVAEMKADYESGKLQFGGAVEKEFVRKVLEMLEVPIESQVLVYSRTSLQTDRIRFHCSAPEPFAPTTAVRSRSAGEEGVKWVGR
jgi:hypothetical protein